MDKVIEISNRAVSDYGFRLAVLYGADDIAQRWELNDGEKSALLNTALPLLTELPNPVEPENVPREQERLAAEIRAAGG